MRSAPQRRVQTNCDRAMSRRVYPQNNATGTRLGGLPRTPRDHDSTGGRMDVPSAVTVTGESEHRGRHRADSTSGHPRLVVSTWMRPCLNFTVWRVVHAAALGTFLVVLAHGVLAGTDSQWPAVQVLYVSSGVVVFGSRTAAS